MKRYFFRILLAGLALPFSGISQVDTTGNAGRPDTAGLRGRADTTVVQPAQVQTGNVITLKECVAIAIKNNLLVQTAGTDLETSDVNKRQSRDNMLPQISGSVNYGENYGRSINNFSNSYTDQKNASGSYGANASLLLFNGLSVQHDIRSTTLAYQARKLDLQQQKDNITLNVILAYVQVLSTRDQLAIARQTASVDSVNVDILRIKDSQGAVAPSDLSDVEGKYALDQVQVTTLENNLETAKISLYNYLNVPYNRDAVYEELSVNGKIQDLGSNSDSIFQQSLQIIPTIRANDLRVQSSLQALGSARGKYWPSLYFGGSVNSNYNSVATAAIPNSAFDDKTGQYVIVNGARADVIGTSSLSQKISFGNQVKNNRYEYIGFTLNVPILNYLQTRNNVKQAKINVEVAKNNSTNTKNQLQQNVESAWQNVKASFSLYNEYTAQTRAYEKSFHAAEVKFKNGAITSVDYVIVKNYYDQAKVNLAAAKYLYLFRSRILDYYQGHLTW